MRKLIFVLCYVLFLVAPCSSQGILESGRDLLDANSEELLNSSSKNLIDVADEDVLTAAASVFERNIDAENVSATDFGVYGLVVRKSSIDVEKSIEKRVERRSFKYVYKGIYGDWLEVVKIADPNTRADFARYFADWQWSQNEDFLKYSSTRAEREKRIEFCYNAAIAKFGVGAAIVGTVWVVSWVVPGGQIVSVSLIVIAKATTVAAFSGGAVGGVLSAGVAYAQGRRGNELLYATVNGAADGFLIGAVTGLTQGTLSAVKNFSGAIAVDGKIYAKSGLVYSSKGEVIGRTVRFAGVENVDDIYYVGKNSSTVFNKSGREVAKVAKYKDNFVLYNDKGRVVGYLKDGEVVSYCDPSSAAIIRDQHRAQPGYETRLEVERIAKMNNQYNPETGRFLDVHSRQDIVGTPEMGHKSGFEYTNELQRAFMNGQSEASFRARMRDPSIYQLESVNGNRSHQSEAARLVIDDFRKVNKDIGKELWEALLMP